MGIKVKARQTKLSVGPSKGEYRFIMQAEIYSTLKQEKVISEASIRSGIPKGSLQAAWEAIGEVVKAWTTEGHSVALPGVGTMRFGLQAAAVSKVEDVGTGLITTRKVIFTPSTTIKQELKDTSINYNPQIQISAESETKRSIFRKRDKTKRSKKESAQHSKSRNKSFVMTSVSAL